MMEFHNIKTNVRDSKRTLVLKKIEGQASKSSTGLTDNRLFTGENKIYAVQNPNTTLWYFKQEQGILPEALNQGFTSFPKLKQFATAYYAKRGAEISDVID